MNTRKKIITGLIILAVFAVPLFIFLSKTEKIRIALYGLNEKERTLITELCTAFLPENEQLVFSVLDDNQPLRKELQKHTDIDLVFAENSLAFEKAKAFFKQLDTKAFEKLASVFSNGGEWIKIAHEKTEESTNSLKADNSYLYAFPLNANVLELVFREIAFYKDELQYSITSTAKLTELFQQAKEKYRYPLCFAGADNEVLSFIISGLLSELRPDYKSEAYQALRTEIDFHKNLPADLQKVLNLLLAWEKAGYLHAQWYDLIKSDVENFLEFDQSAVACMMTGDDGPIARDFLRGGVRKKMLFADTLRDMNLPARLLLLSVIEKKPPKKKSEVIEKICVYFQSEEAQYKIAKSLNFAAAEYGANTTAVLSNAADWIYSAQSLVPSIDKILFETRSERDAFFKEVRSYLQAKGNGYGAAEQ